MGEIVSGRIAKHSLLERLMEIQWGDRTRDPEGYCPSCGRSEGGYSGRHAYGCAVRELLDFFVERAPQ